MKLRSINISNGTHYKTVKPPIGLCVVGCGQIARRHMKSLSLLKDKIKLVSVVDSDIQRAKDFAKQYGAAHWSESYAEAFAQEFVDAVLLCLPHHLHCPVTIAAAKEGLHILCEKPMALNVNEAQSMIEAATNSRVVLMIGHNRRFLPAVTRAKELLQSGALGEIRHISTSFLSYIETPSTSWRTSSSQTGGFMIPIFGTHLIDLVMWVTGFEVQRVYCVTAEQRDSFEGDDEAMAILTMQSKTDQDNRSVGCTVLLSANYRRGTSGRRDSREELIISGDKGSIAIENRKLVLNGEPETLPDLMGWDDFSLQLNEFANAIIEGREPISSGWEGKKVTQILDACHYSARTGTVWNPDLE